jgi:hypothetical protein
MNHAADQQLIEAVPGSDEVAVAQALADGADPKQPVGGLGLSADQVVSVFGESVRPR